MSDTLRIGIAGATWTGNQHAKAFSQLEGVSLEAVADLSEDLRGALQSEFSVPHSYSSCDEMIASGNIDAIVIAVPNTLHEVVSSQALDAGIHVLCEKPPAANVSEMSGVVTTAGLMGVTYMFASQSRYLQSTLKARQMIADGEIGTAYHAEVYWYRSFSDFDQNSWRSSRSQTGGALFNLGPHIIDRAWFAMGCPRPTEASASSHMHFIPESYKRDFDAADDSSFGMLRFRDGVSISYGTTYFSHREGPRNDQGLPEWQGSTILGSKASLDLEKGTKSWMSEDGFKTESYLNNSLLDDAFAAQAAEFVAAIREKRAPLSPGSEALTLLRMLDALRESGKENRSIEIKTKPSLDDFFGSV